MESKHNRVNLSCTVPFKTKEKLNKIAEYEDQTVSRLAAQAISLFVKEKERQEHPALISSSENNQPQLTSATETIISGVFPKSSLPGP